MFGVREEERRSARSSSSLRTAALRGGSGVLARPLPFSDFEGVGATRCADGLCGGGRIRSEVQAVPPRGGMVVVTVRVHAKYKHTLLAEGKGIYSTARTEQSLPETCTEYI